MTCRTFFKWLEKEGFIIRPLEPHNSIGGVCVKITHKNKHGYKYFSGPFGDVEMINKDIIDICDKFYHKHPDGIAK